MENKNVKTLLFELLTQSTGIAMMDSGGGDGRAWQRAQKLYPTIQALENAPQVTWDLYNEPETSKELEYSVNTFHYLKNVLKLDELCNEFNALPVKDWDSDIYGVSVAGRKWLDKHSAEIGDSWNTYNGENVLDRVLQGTQVKFAGGVDTYVLLQVHGGADVRGGYTDAKLFLVPDDYINPTPNVYGTIDGVEVDSCYNGYNLTACGENGNDGEAVPVKTDSIISLSLSL